MRIVAAPPAELQAAGGQHQPCGTRSPPALAGTRVPGPTQRPASLLPRGTLPCHGVGTVDISQSGTQTLPLGGRAAGLNRDSRCSHPTWTHRAQE